MGCSIDFFFVIGVRDSAAGARPKDTWVRAVDALPRWMRAHSPELAKSSGSTEPMGGLAGSAGFSCSKPCFSGASKYSVTGPTAVRRVIGLGMVGNPPCVLDGGRVCYRFYSHIVLTDKSLAWANIWCTIDFVEGNVVAQRLRIDDQPLCCVGRNCLAALVMGYVALRAPHAFGESNLGDAKAFAYRFYRVHGQIVAALLWFVNSGAVLILIVAALLFLDEKERGQR